MRRIFDRGSFVLLLGLWLFLTSLPLSAAPSNYEYYILNPRIENGALTVISLADRNTIRAGATTLTLNRYQTGSIPAGPDLAPGMLISATGAFTLGSEVDATDLPVPGHFIGTSFVIPHYRNDHTYYILSPRADAQVTITVEGVPTVLTAQKGQVLTYSAGSTNNISGLIQSDQPILVAHAANNGWQDVYPVPPVAKILWGVRSNTAIVGAMEDNTTITVTGSSGATESFTLDAGGYRTLTIPGATQGSGSAVHIVADKPIAAIQSADGDGVEATAFLDTPYLATHYALPVDAQYVAVVCPQFTNVTLTNGGLTETQACSGDGTQPGKAYFGDTTNGDNINAGAYIEADRPVYVYYEASAANDEHNITGRKDNYYSLNSRFQNGPLSVMSLHDDNWITAGNSTLLLDQNERGTIAGADLLPGTEIWGTGPFTLGSEVDGTDLPVPGSFAGTTFIIPHARDTHTYYLSSPYGEAGVSVDIGGVVSNYTIAPDQVLNIDAGSDTTVAGIIESDRPILVSHQAGSAGDAYPVPPAATELWGIRSANVSVAASEDNTTVQVYTSDAQTATYTLNAGVRRTVTVGTSTSQGQGAAIHLVADKPIAAIQLADSDGYEATAFLQAAYHGNRFGLPVDTQYVAIVCPTPGTKVTLYEPLKVPATQTCSGIGEYPGKIYFGSEVNGVNIAAGSYLNADQPIYAIYEASATNDEHNLLGYNLLSDPDPSAPVLNAPPATTENNPLTVTGMAAPNMEVRLYVNGVQQATTTSSAADGSFSFSAALIDDSNEIYATTWDGSQESHHSNVETVTYTNTLPRNWDNRTLTSDTVWTPGSTPEPYIITGTLTVDIGKKFVLQPGVVVEFAASAQLVVNGTVVIHGEAGNKVILEGINKEPGSWLGVAIRPDSKDSVIENAIIEWATNGVSVNGTYALVQNNTILNFTGSGVRLSNGSAAEVSGNTISSPTTYVFRTTGGLGSLTSHGIHAQDPATSPTIRGNVITRTDAGVYVVNGATPRVVDSNRITGNNYGIYLQGGMWNAGVDPRPVVNFNSIYDNGIDGAGNRHGYRDYYMWQWEDDSIVLDATKNWWGAADFISVGQRIYEAGDFSGLPVVNFGNYLDTYNGVPVAGNYIYGNIDNDTVTLEAGKSYIALSNLTVREGKTLTIPPGVKIYFRQGSGSNRKGLNVFGTLLVLGTTGSPVVFDSILENPGIDSWNGIIINETSTGTIIHNAVIQHARYGVYIVSSSPTISNSLIQGGRYGIYISRKDSSGAFKSGEAKPVITSNRIINNNYGIWINGEQNYQENPAPIITGNDIYQNSRSSVYIYNYGTNNGILIDLTGNWWGVPEPVIGTDIKYSLSDQVADVSGYATSPLRAATVSSIALDRPYFSPAVAAATTISATLTDSSAWSIEIRDSANQLVRTLASGTGSTISQAWDGRDDMGQPVPDGEYYFLVLSSSNGVMEIAGSIKAVIDTKPPQAVLDQEINGSLITGVTVYPVIGTVSDQNIQEYRVEYGAGDAPDTWNLVDTAISGKLVTLSSVIDWALHTEKGTVNVPTGIYTLRLSAIDKAGNVSIDTVLLTVDVLSISNVSYAPMIINPANDEVVDIRFTLTKPALVTMDILNEESLQSVGQVAQQCPSAGECIIRWDGKVDNQYLPDGAYVFTLHAESGTESVNYSLTGESLPVSEGASRAGSIDSRYNILKNDFLALNINVNRASRLSLRISYYTENQTLKSFDAVSQKPLMPGAHMIYWDGRETDGSMLMKNVSWNIPAPRNLRYDTIIIEGGMPVITGTGTAPNIEVKPDPYLVMHSYDQISRFTYRIDQDSYVTLKILPPGITNIDDEDAVTVFDNVLQAANDSNGNPKDYLIDWRGYNETDINNIMIASEGVHTFVIMATSHKTGFSSIYRGAIQLFK